MAVTWVGGTSFAQATGTSVSATSPAGLDSGDLLLAAVAARSTITPPAGWTLVAQTADFTDGTSTQRLAVYRKNSTTSGDSSTSFTWSQASSAPISVCYAAARGADSSPTSATATVDNYSDFEIFITPPTVTATASGQLIVVFASTTEGDPAGGNPDTPSGWTLFTQSTASDYRLAGIYKAVGSGDTPPGGFSLDIDYFDSGTFGLGAISLLLDEGGGGGGGDVEAAIAADGPLGAVRVLGQQPAAAQISAPSVLSDSALLGWHDISSQVDAEGASRYLMDLITPSGNVRVPISSWQGTLQVDAAQYVQCVVPAVDAWVDDISDATAFRITRLLTLNDGSTLEYLVVECPLDTIQYARGSTNYTATLSGYLPAPAAITWPPGTERELEGVRTVFTYPSGLRVRCSIDWLLQPGQQAAFGETTFDVAYINFIVSETDAYMDVGQRIEAD